MLEAIAFISIHAGIRKLLPNGIPGCTPRKLRFRSRSSLSHATATVDHTNSTVALSIQGKKIGLQGINQLMNSSIRTTAILCLWLPITFSIVAAEKQSNTNRVPAEVLAFCAEKERYAKSLANELKVEIPSEISDFFTAAKKSDWPRVDELYELVRMRYMAPSDSKEENKLGAVINQSALEIELAKEQFVQGNSRLALALGKDILASMPQGSIFFGGNDAGQALATTLSKSHASGNPVFTITQNALANGRYLSYLRTIYESQIFVPADQDSERSFAEYTADAQRRAEHDRDFPKEPRQVKPGEDIRLTESRKVQLSGHVAVMQINGLLAKILFEQNPAREFFVVESFPLDWMYPHLSPNGPILKLNRKPPTELSLDLVEKDRKYWSQQQSKLIGSWLTPKTSVKEICQFVDKVFVAQNFDGFSGDREFIRDERAQKNFSKLRGAIGGLYFWRSNKATSPEEKTRMNDEADFAFRQAFVFSPNSAEALFRYVNLLVQAKRYDDALSLTDAAIKVNTEIGGLLNLQQELHRLKERS
jgi:tetratricopeptide (TPR) repeat protein